MEKELNKEFIVYEINKYIYALRREYEVSEAIFKATGIECDLKDDHPQVVLRDAYESLIWNLILMARKCPELASEEFECFSDLVLDASWGDKSDWNAEKIYDYFTDVEQVIKDFNIGVVDEKEDKNNG